MGALAITVAKLKDEETMLQRLAPIIEMLEDEDPEVREAAVEALKKMGLTIPGTPP